jgi:NAD(P)-dependent dehydrogenase (short-subunit alcohol dehydrogenase family)
MAIAFDGQVAVVTGAGRGLGAAHARLLAELGAAVVVADAGVGLGGVERDPAVAHAVVAGITGSGGTAVACYEDLIHPGACERVIDFAIAKLGRLDVLISNAGLLTWTAIEDVDDDLWRRYVKVGVEAPFLLARAAIPIMKRQSYGRIVVTVSGRAMYVQAALTGLTAYSIGKASQLGLMVALAAEGEPFGIRINAISPVAATRMLNPRVEPGEMTPEQVSPGVVSLLRVRATSRERFCAQAEEGSRSSGGSSATRWTLARPLRRPTTSRAAGPKSPAQGRLSMARLPRGPRAATR